MSEQPKSLESQLQMARPRRGEVERVPLTSEEKEFLGEIMDKAVAAEKAGELQEALNFYTDYKNKLMKIKEKRERRRKRQESTEPVFNTELINLQEDTNQELLRNKNASEVKLTDEASYELLLSLNKDYLEAMGFDLKELRKKDKKGRPWLPTSWEIILEVQGIEGFLVGSIHHITDQHEDFNWHIISNIEPDDILEKDTLGIIKSFSTEASARRGLFKTNINFNSGKKISFGIDQEKDTGYTQAFFSFSIE